MAKKVVFKMPPTGDPVKGVEKTEVFTPGRGPIESNFDLRDRIYELIGSKNQLDEESRKSLYGNLISLVGPDKAQKLLVQTHLFNKHPEYGNLPVEDRIQQFYNIGSNDPDVKDILDRTRNLSYGLKHGFRTSISHINQLMAGRLAPTSTPVDPVVKETLTKSMPTSKVVLKVKK
jgi:hypothetical protein